MENQQWERDFDDKFVSSITGAIKLGSQFHSRTQEVKDFIRTQRTAAQVELLETILRSELAEPFDDVSDWKQFIEFVRSRLEARLSNLTNNA